MNILVVQTGFLGDVVLSTPVIGNLQRLYPEARISVMTTPEARELVEHHPAVYEVITFDKRKSHSGWQGLWKMVQEVRERNFDLAFSLHKSWRTALLLWFADIPIRYGFREAAGESLYTKTVPRKHLKHEVLRNLAILENIDAKIERLEQKLFVATTAEAEIRARELLGGYQQKKLIGISPGSVWRTKRWPPEGFSEVAKTFLELGYGVVLLGGAADKEIGEQIEKLVERPLLNLIGRTSLIELAAAAKLLKLMITNDSAPLHIAASAQTPVVAVFCATVPEFGFSAWGVPNESVGVSGLKCRPCGRHGGNSCPTKTEACMKELKPASVIAAARKLLSEAELSLSGSEPDFESVSAGS